MAVKLWKKFERDLKNLVSNIDNSVLKKLKSSFLMTPLCYLTSDECEVIMKDTIDKISYNKVKIYIHLLDFKKSLKSATKLKRNAPIEPVVEAKRRKLVENEDNIDNFLVKVKDEDEEFLNYYNGCTTSTSEAPKVDDYKSRIDKYIAKLENVLQATQVQIIRLEEEELSLDDLDQENNSFIMLDKLKAHCVKVWRKICKLTKTSDKLRRRHLSKFSFKETIYPDLNVIIEDLVKKKKFPDYNDIKTAVSTFVTEKPMKMSTQRITELSVDIFTQIGNKLKKLRIGDFVNYFGNHLTDQVKSIDNPILSDRELKRVLMRNYEDGQIKMDQLLDKFSKYQYENNIKEDENASDISTEHSANSDNDDIDDNIAEINLETLQHEANQENLGIDESEDSDEETGADKNQTETLNINQINDDEQINEEAKKQVYTDLTLITRQGNTLPVRSLRKDKNLVEVATQKNTGQSASLLVNKDCEEVSVTNIPEASTQKNTYHDWNLMKKRDLTDVVMTNVHEFLTPNNTDIGSGFDGQDVIVANTPAIITHRDRNLLTSSALHGNYSTSVLGANTQDTISQENKEAQLEEMAAHTFKFNIDQIRQGEKSTFYPDTITIESSDSDSSDESSEDFLNGEVNKFAYSSKLDEFCIVKPKNKEIFDTGIVISLDDSDEEVS